MAHIGGSPKPGNSAIGYTIDTYNFDTSTETLNVSQMEYNRKMHSCAMIPVGENGNPTVAICKSFLTRCDRLKFRKTKICTPKTSFVSKLYFASIFPHFLYISKSLNL